MKRYKITLLFLLLSISAIAQKNITISFLADEQKDNTNMLLLQAEIKAVLGSKYQVTFKKPLINNYDLEKARQNYNSINSNTTQLIIASGSTNAYLFYREQQVKIPTIIIGGINKDLIKIPNRQKTSQKHNVNYIVLPNSYSGDLDDFSTIYKYKKVGIIVNQNRLNTLPVKKAIDAYFSKKETSYLFIPLINNKIDITLLKEVDAVYLADGFFLSPFELKDIISSINDNKLPSFSKNGIQDVEKGMLVSNKPSGVFKQLLKKVALNSEAIVNGTNPSELPIFIEYNNLITVNYATLKQLGMKLRYSLLGTANIIGGKEVLNTKNTYSLKAIMNNVVHKNLGLQSEKKNIELAEQDIKLSKSNYLPDVNANVQGIYIDPEIAKYATGQNPEMEAKGNIAFKQVLFSPDANTGIKINKKVAEAQQENYNTTQLDALFNAASAYFNALIIKTNANIQNQNLQLTKQNLEIAKQNFNAGASGKSDVLRFRSQLAQNTQSVIDAGNQLRQMHLTINQLMNEPIGNEINLEDADIATGLFKDYNYKKLMALVDSPELSPKLVSFFIEQAYKNSPELKSIYLNKEIVALNYRLNDKGRFLPTIALQGQYNIGILKRGKGATVPVGLPNLPNNNYNFALNISLPIFDQNSRNIKRTTAKIQHEQLEYQQQSLTQNIEKQVHEVLLDLVSAIASIEISKISEETAKESLDLTQTAYQTGAITVIQLIDAQNNYLQSKLGSATAKYQFILTSMQIERIMGRFFIMSTPEENNAFFSKAYQYFTNQN